MMQTDSVGKSRTGWWALPVYTRATIAGLLWVALLFLVGDSLKPALEGDPIEGALSGLAPALFFAAPALVLAAMLVRFRTWPSLLAVLWMLFIFAMHVQFVIAAALGIQLQQDNGLGAESGVPWWMYAYFGLFFVLLAFIGAVALISFVQHRRDRAQATSTKRERVLFAAAAIAAVAALGLVLII